MEQLRLKGLTLVDCWFRNAVSVTVLFLSTVRPHQAPPHEHIIQRHLTSFPAHTIITSPARGRLTMNNPVS